MKTKISGMVILITIVSCWSKKKVGINPKEKIVTNKETVDSDIERHITVLSQSGKVVYYHLSYDDFNSGKIDMETISGGDTIKYIYKYEHNFISKNDTLAISGNEVSYKKNKLFFITEKSFFIDGKTLNIGKYFYEGDYLADHLYIDKSKGIIMRHDLYHHGLVEYHINSLPKNTFSKIMQDSTFFYVNSHNLRE